MIAGETIVGDRREDVGGNTAVEEIGGNSANIPAGDPGRFANIGGLRCAAGVAWLDSFHEAAEAALEGGVDFFVVDGSVRLGVGLETVVARDNEIPRKPSFLEKELTPRKPLWEQI